MHESWCAFLDKFQDKYEKKSVVTCSMSRMNNIEKNSVGCNKMGTTCGLTQPMNNTVIMEK
jgi:hypothetical protein